ncbi:MAG: Trk system potassium transporter TrkH [Acidimicrobiales bacterium]|nr:MAG: Trk system potassium transporter TrkH [Acidimicrobiales bacterium]
MERVGRSSELVHRRHGFVESLTGALCGPALVAVGAAMSAAALVDLTGDGGASGELAVVSLATVGAGAFLWWMCRPPEKASRGDAMVAVSVTWLASSAAGALPFLAAGVLTNPDDALFESISGFTATGSTVISPLEGVDRGILFWRQTMQWLGGMGMVLLAVAVLPYLRVGGMELLAAEAPGPEVERLAPRLRDTAIRLWGVYALLTGLVAIGLLAAGTGLFDAVSHAFAALATGGFSPHDASVAYFDSAAVEIVLIFGMVAGGTNFALWASLLAGRPRAMLASGQLRWYLTMLVVVSVLVWMVGGSSTRLRDAVFTVTSLATTTGFATADYTTWSSAAQLLLIGVMLAGSMTGSTSGALKIMRVQVLAGFARRELIRARQPLRVLGLRVDGRPVPEAVVANVVAFVGLYFLTAVVSVVVVTALGSDIVTAIGGVVTTMGGVGPGVGEAGPSVTFEGFTRPARLVLAFDMLLGRLEIVPVLVTVTLLANRLREATGRRR